MKTQLEQTSQQIQDEMLELLIENQLHRLLPQDEIKKIKKGQRVSTRQK